MAQDLLKIDSLKNLNIGEKDQKKVVDNLNTIAGEFSHNNTDSALFYIEKALTLAQQISYAKGEAEAYFMQSYYYDVLGNNAQAIASLENATRIFTEMGDSSYLSGCYNNLGAFYSYGKNQKKSLEYFIKSIQIGEAIKDSFSLAEAYSNVAGFYDDLKEYTSALKYYKKGLDVDLHYNESENIAVSYLDVGYINIKLRRYDDALIQLQKARGLLAEIKDPYFQTILYHRFATYYNETGDLKLANEYIVKAYNICKNYDYPILMADMLSLKGEILLKEKKYKSSLSVLDSAIAQYTDLESTNSLYDIYKNKAKAYSGLGLHNEAYRFLQMSNMRDESPVTNVIAETLSNFEKEEALKEERDRLKLEQELRVQKDENTLIKVQSRLYFTIYVAILLGVVLVVGLYFYVLKRNHNKLLESNYELINHQKELLQTSYSDLKSSEASLAELNATKDKFFSIIAHDLKNPFNTMIGISELLVENPEIKNTDDYEELMLGLFETAKSGHDLLENLLEWSRSQIGTLKMEPRLFEIDEIIKSTVSFFSETTKAKEIRIYIPTENNYTVYADYNMVNFIIRNMLNNAIKFSYQGSQIEILTSTRGNELIICIKDYGIGMDQETLDKLFKIEHSVQQNGTNNEKGTGLGLILCKEFVEKNNGTISVESTKGKGSLFCIGLPMSS